MEHRRFARIQKMIFDRMSAKILDKLPGRSDHKVVCLHVLNDFNRYLRRFTGTVPQPLVEVGEDFGVAGDRDDFDPSIGSIPNFSVDAGTLCFGADEVTKPNSLNPSIHDKPHCHSDHPFGSNGI